MNSISKNKFTTLTSIITPLLVENIDTDQIIPARFLKITNKADLGDNAFADWRYDKDGNPKKDFVLNDRKYAGSQILLAGNNFGCGSSREHAPWALKSFGFRAIISTSFADIFRSNALKNQLLPVQISNTDFAVLKDMINEVPIEEFTIDLKNQQIITPVNHTIQFPIDKFYKTCLMNGVDELGYILSFNDKIQAYETKYSK